MAYFNDRGYYCIISIPYWKRCEDKKIVAVVEVKIEDVMWTVERPYSEFEMLHEILVANYGVCDVLPPLTSDTEGNLIEDWRIALDKYFHSVVSFLRKTWPEELAEFLEFDEYETPYIVKKLAAEFDSFKEIGLSKVKAYTLTPTQVFAINRIFKKTTDNKLQDKAEKFSLIVLDFCNEMNELTFFGSFAPLLNSNIVPNKLRQLKFDVFKQLETLYFQDVNFKSDSILKRIILGSLRSTLKNLTINRCDIAKFLEILMCDKLVVKANCEWENLTTLSITNTRIQAIDESLKLTPKLKELILDSNEISEICDLTFLPNLEKLSLKMNRLSNLDPIEAPALISLDLSENYLQTLEPFKNLKSLESLNLQMNEVKNIEEIKHIANLPCLENLVLTGNPISQWTDYRAKTLEYFGQRACRICLDNESPTPREMSHAYILTNFK